MNFKKDDELHLIKELSLAQGEDASPYVGQSEWAQKFTDVPPGFSQRFFERDRCTFEMSQYISCA
jgi:hypothetical protein